MTKEIAEHLFISPKTVSRHLANLRRRYGVASAPALVSLFYPEPGGRLKLTPREAAVFELIRSGLGSLHIARELGVSFTTVRRHRENMLLKNECTTIRQLMALFISGERPPGPQ
ncbi:hypothetical protein C4J81_19110 (plasmid) [Deltaproteobacteria bacterium Smac51]|nr:hypothetical protein C4J81_19110 [Deltaproteobacteria bacterium Smac51]